jgi:ribonuclease P protein component
MRSSKDFQRTTRRGVRVGRPTLVVHAARIPDGDAIVGAGAGRSAPRVGFIVNRSLGNAVIRNRVKRRLRHLVAARVAEAPAEIGVAGIDLAGIDVGGIDIVVRALPRAATDPARVPIDFESAWRDAVSRLTSRRPERAGDTR